jgi:septum formation protein
MDLHKPLILASRSPRRIALLRQIGLFPQVAPCELPEDFDSCATPIENAKNLALQKARCIAREIGVGVILGADTIVQANEGMFGKPVDRNDAVRMLSRLSGTTHTVITAFALVDKPSGSEIVDYETTLVTFRDLPREEIDQYVDGGSPMDKAGAYGIQDDYGAVFVTRIDGCFYNVVGLPLARLHVRLRELRDQWKSEKG